MTRTILLIALVAFAISCKKKDGQNDTIKYDWKRDLYRAAVKNDGPASTGPASDNIDLKQAIYVSTDKVILTEKAMVEQRDSIYKASAQLFAYKYQKIK